MCQKNLIYIYYESPLLVLYSGDLQQMEILISDKISSVASKIVNTPVLIIVVHLKFHLNKEKIFQLYIDNIENYCIINIVF